MAAVGTRGLSTKATWSHPVASPEFKIELTRLHAQLKERLSRGSSTSFDFFNGALSALSTVKGTAHAELRLECLFCCMQFFYTSGFTEAALRGTRELEALASRAQDKSWKRRARTLSGIMFADTGNVSEALICYADALTIAREIKDKKAEAIVLNNLGGAFTYGSLFDEAIACFRKVASQLAEPEVADQAVNAIGNLAQLHLYTEAYADGLAETRRYLELSEEPNDAASALNRTIAEFFYVQLALGLNQTELARSRLEQCVRYSRWGDTKRSTFLAAVAEGLFEVHAGDVHRGISKLEDALRSATETNHARNNCLIALVKAFDEAGQPERALEYLRALQNQVRAKREASISALMALPMHGSGSFSHDSLDVLERQEYKLRAVVAEREVVHSRMEMLERLAVTADLKEEKSGEHGYRVGKLSALLANELGWQAEASASLELAARLHDLGKVGVADRILFTSETLRDTERAFIGTHTVIGGELLAKSNVPQLRLAEDVARYHHEWWDGTGYPSKLKGKRIPSHARIVALADVFDALTHGRPYSEPWSMDRALEEIRNRRGTQFDPEMTDAFLDIVARLRTEHHDLDAYLAKAAINSRFAQARNKIRSMLAEEHAHEREIAEAQLEAHHSRKV